MNNNTTISVVQKYIAVALMLGGLVFSYATSVSAIQAVEQRVTTLEERQDEIDPILLNIQVDLAEIKTSLEFIKDGIQ